MIEKVIIMGAAGRDFHNFNIYFRENPRYKVIAFTAAQIPNIEGRLYPPELSGQFYPDGIPVYPEEELAELISLHKIDLVAFSYSDISHIEVMHKAALVMAHGADFTLIGATYTMLKSSKPVISVCAVRTGCGKSPTTRKVAEILQAQGKKVVVVRHPMPYGDLKQQIVQRFSSYQDFETHHCTIEEREEYEPIVERGIVVYAGKEILDYLLENETDDIDGVIEKLGLKQVSDSGALEALIDEVLSANPEKLAEYKSGKDKLFGFFVGQAMKASKGSANPQTLNELLLAKLA